MKSGAWTLVLLYCICSFGQDFAPKGGFVPDSETAVKIAEAVLVPVYGKKEIESERPFSAALETSIWTITGTMHCPGSKEGVITLCDGGVAEVKISKKDGRVLHMIHGK